MRKPWRLTRGAEASLAEIAAWTIETFGPRQAATYKEDLISACNEIAAGSAISYDCRRLVDDAMEENLRFVRAGQHFVVYLDQKKQIIVIDFLHARSDLPRRLAELSARKPQGQSK